MSISLTPVDYLDVKIINQCLDVKIKLWLYFAMTDKSEQRRDHVSRLIAKRRSETPAVPLDGMEIIGRARRLTILSRPAIEAVFSRHGIDTGEFDVLATLRRSGTPFELRPTELMRDLIISSGGLTDRLNRLERKGLVIRRIAAGDRRSSLARLSEKGRLLIDDAFAEDMAVEEEMLAPLSDTERQTLADLLARLLAHMEKNGDS